MKKKAATMINKVRVLRRRRGRGCFLGCKMRGLFKYTNVRITPISKTVFKKPSLNTSFLRRFS